MATKRSADNTTLGGDSKKCKQNEKLLSLVADGIKAADIPPTVKELLAEVMKTSLAVVKEDRHKFQNDAIEMVSNVLIELVGSLEQKAKDLETTVAMGDAEKSECQQKIKEAEALVATKKEEVSKAKHILADFAAKFKSAREAVDAAQADLTVAEKNLKDTSSKKQRLEVAQRDQAKPLIEGTVPEGEMTNMVQMFIASMQEFNFEESVITALPTALGKLPASRGPFDAMVLKQLDDEVAKRIDAFGTTLRTGEVAKAERFKVIENAQADLSKAMVALKAGAVEFNSSESGKDASDISLCEAKQVLKNIGNELRKRTRELESVQAKLAKHQAGALVAFGELRDCTRPQVQDNAASPEALEGDAEAPANTDQMDIDSEKLTKDTTLLESSPKLVTAQEAGA